MVNVKGGLGFVGMRGRLRLVRGKVAIDSKPTAGTRIECVFLSRRRALPEIDLKPRLLRLR